MKPEFFTVYKTLDCHYFFPSHLQLVFFNGANMTKKITEAYNKENLEYSDFHFSITIFQSWSSTVCLDISCSTMFQEG